MDANKDDLVMQPPPSRLDMDTELHQAISMAHRINEKMELPDKGFDHAPAAEDVPEIIEEEVDDDVTEAPSSKCYWKMLSKDDMTKITLLFVTILIGPVVFTSIVDKLPLWSSLSNNPSYSFLTPVVKALVITLVYVVILRVFYSI